MSETINRRENERRAILIVGGTGNVGRHVVPALLEKGERVRVLTRDPERARGLLGAGAEIVPGDLSEPSSVRPALEGVERVYLATNGGDQALMEFNLALSELARVTGWEAAAPPG